MAISATLPKAGQVFKHFLRGGGKRLSFRHQLHHVVGETPGVNLGQIPLPRRFAGVEFYKVFFGERGEELDRKERVARSFFVHEPREGFGTYPVTTKSVCDKVVHVLERERLENDLVHGDSGFADRVQGQHQRMRWAHFVVPICADDQEVFNIRMTEEMFDEA